MNEAQTATAAPRKGRASACGIALALLLAALAFNQLRFLGTPLFWNDEGHTVMTGKFTLEYGYPRVTDGRNIVFADRIVDGVYQNFDPRLEATTHSIWLAYYWAAFAVWLARLADDPHTRTAIIRACFAAVGLLGIGLFWRGVAHRLRGTGDERAFGLGFLSLTLLSVSLVLHLREVRYYTLVFFEGGLLLYLYAHWRSELPRMRLRWLAGLAGGLAATFLTFYPAYFIFGATIAVIELGVLLAAITRPAPNQPFARRLRAGLVDGLRAGSPVGVSFLLVLPTFGYFEPFAKAGGELRWGENLGILLTFLARYEFLIPVALTDGVVALLLIHAWRRGRLRAALSDRRLSTAAALHAAFAVYAGVIARVPQPGYLFTRYFIPLIPIVSAAGVLELLWVRAWLREHAPTRPLGRLVAVLVVASALPYLGAKLDTWYGRILELRRPYRGPLDFAIPYLLDRFGDETRNLVLATNYEEPVFMYYLDCKVTIGYRANHVKDDLRYVPDVIVYRRWWGTHQQIFRRLLAAHRYEEIPFPVLDYPVNNIPQFEYPIPHQYQTQFSDDPEQRFTIYLRKD